MMKMLASVFVLVLLTACATTGEQSAAPAGMDRPITGEEITASEYTDAYELVRSRRPRWLRTRGAQSIELGTAVQVYVNGVLRGGPETLRELSTSSIQEIRYYDPGEATMRFGTGNPAGAIEVIL